MNLRFSTAFIVVAALLSAAPLAGYAAGDDSESPGRAAFAKGRRYFEAGEAKAALPWFEKAYKESNRRPSVILALAQCERTLEMYDRSISHFREYLLTNPPADRRGQVEETVRLLEEIVADRNAQAEKKKPKTDVAPPAAPKAEAAEPDLTVAAPAEDESSVWSSPILWIGVGVAAVGAGIAIGFAASGTEDAYGGTTGVVLER